MAPLRYVRCTIFKISQHEMANIAGVQQPTISRWETARNEISLKALARIRDEAKRRRLRWDDRWFLDKGGVAA